MIILYNLNNPHNLYKFIFNSIKMDPHKFFLQKKFTEVTKLIPKKKSLNILDIGCNNGNIRHHLSSNIEYYGTDINKFHIHNLQVQGIKAKQIDLNTQQLPFQFEKFDYILLLDVLEHVLDPSKLLKDSRKRLKEDGKLIVTLPNDYHILNKLRFIFNKHLTEDPFAPYGHLHIFPIKSGENLIRKSGFKILKKIPIPPIKPLRIPKIVKDFLSNTLPQTFARDILYLVEPI